MRENIDEFGNRQSIRQSFLIQIHVYNNLTNVFPRQRFALYDMFLFVIVVHYFTYRLTAREFNSYGSRRGNDAIMARGTFANIRLVNKFIGKAAPKTIHIPSGETVSYKYYAI